MPRPPRPQARRRPGSRLLLAAAAIVLQACGKKGPPLPPIRILPRPPQAVHLRQSGADVIVEAQVTLRRTDDTPLGTGAALRLLRMRPADTLNPHVVSARYLLMIFEKEAKVQVSISGAELRPAAGTGIVVLHDGGAYTPPVAAAPSPPPTGTAAPGETARGSAAPHLRYLYALQIVDDGGQRSPLTLPQEIVLAPPPAPPAHPTVATAEGEVRLAWDSGAPGETGETYNVYRLASGETQEPSKPLNETPLKERDYVDRKFQYGETYRYRVRALLAPPPPLRESLPGPEIEVRPLDVYAPKAPTGLAATVEGAEIKLYWFPNNEPDLHAYRIYRRVAPGEWALIGTVDAAETSFADTTGAHGVRYDYAVTAIDAATPPNESPRSESVSEGLAGDAAGAPGGRG